jgi:hypothetical protein
MRGSMNEQTTRLHPADDVLELYCLGRLREESLQSVEEHLFHCEHCVNRAEAMESDLHVMKQALSAWPQREMDLKAQKDARRPLMRWWLSAAALVLIGLPIAYSLKSEPVYQATIATYRAEEIPEVPSGKVDLLVLSDGLPEDNEFQIALYDSNRKLVWQSQAQRQQLRVKPDVRLSPGLYQVHIFSAAQTGGQTANLLREILFRVR